MYVYIDQPETDLKHNQEHIIVWTTLFEDKKQQC